VRLRADGGERRRKRVVCGLRISFPARVERAGQPDSWRTQLSRRTSAEDQGQRHHGGDDGEQQPIERALERRPGVAERRAWPLSRCA